MSNSDTNLGLTANLDTEVGKVVVDLGLATRTEVEFCREQQKQSSDPNQRSLGDLLVENAFITVNQAKRIRGQLEERRNSQLPGYQILGKLGKGDGDRLQGPPDFARSNRRHQSPAAKDERERRVRRTLL